jgi:hypothetical protein
MAIRSVEMQVRRLSSEEPEDEKWHFRKWTDFEFLVQALWRVRLCANIAQDLEPHPSGVAESLNVFDENLPDLARMRHVAQHIDEYATDGPGRRQKYPRIIAKNASGLHSYPIMPQTAQGEKKIGRRGLEIGHWSDSHFSWLGGTVQYETARTAAWGIVCALREARAAERR